MYRKSIYENNKGYCNAVKKVFELKKQGFKEEEIPDKISNLYQENEITRLINDIKKLSGLNGNHKLKNILKISLWILLLIKLLILPFVIIPIEIPAIWKILAITIGILITGLSLYLTYKSKYEIVFFIILLTAGLSTDTFVENIRSLFTTSVLTIGWWLGLLMNLSLIIAFYSSWKLRRVYSNQLLMLDRIIKQENLI